MEPSGTRAAATVSCPHRDQPPVVLAPPRPIARHGGCRAVGGCGSCPRRLGGRVREVLRGGFRACVCAAVVRVLGTLMRCCWCANSMTPLSIKIAWCCVRCCPSCVTWCAWCDPLGCSCWRRPSKHASSPCWSAWWLVIPSHAAVFATPPAVAATVETPWWTGMWQR